MFQAAFTVIMMCKGGAIDEAAPTRMPLVAFDKRAGPEPPSTAAFKAQLPHPQGDAKRSPRWLLGKSSILSS
jgi:hypothetical protein